MHVTPAGFITPYDFQFYFFHLCLYLGPLFFAMPDWTRRRREGRLEELMCTALSRYELLWAFILPWFLRIFAIIYLLYLTMLPWFNWWLLRFGEQCGNMAEFPKYYWTSWHCYITLQYFVTTLLFNLVAVVWVSLRRQRSAARTLSYLMVTVALDFLAYTICSCFYPPYTREGNNVLIWLFTCIIPYFFNLSLLSAH